MSGYLPAALTPILARVLARDMEFPWCTPWYF